MLSKEDYDLYDEDQYPDDIERIYANASVYFNAEPLFVGLERFFTDESPFGDSFAELEGDEICVSARIDGERVIHPHYKNQPYDPYAKNYFDTYEYDKDSVSKSFKDMIKDLTDPEGYIEVKFKVKSEDLLSGFRGQFCAYAD